MPEATRDLLHRQQRAAKVLGQLLGRAVNEKLPAISWAIAGSPSHPALAGNCDADDAADRRRDFEAWRDALAAGVLPEEVDAEGRTRLRASVTDTYEDITIELVAHL
uniref:hypothetical protein n=1 Tax=Nonomuraea pusilla TaxID=46177 RepID=UPI0006E19E6B|nr:hypothetical protein [Nonomuraea pusilla]